MSVVLQNPGVERVRAALAAARLDAEIVELPGAARTARAAAQYLGCDVAQIANSLVFRALSSDAALLVLSSGARRVDLDRLAGIVGESVGKADADFVRARTGFAIGGVAPVGHAGPVRSYVERSLAGRDPLWAAAGHPHTVFRLSYAELLRISAATPIDAACA